MLKQQSRESTADPPTVKCKNPNYFQMNMAETNNGVDEPVYCADPCGSEIELQDRELSFTLRQM